MREFTRVAWASDRARQVWEPRVQAIQAAWLDVELTSVVEGLRPAALVFNRAGLFNRLRELDLQWVKTSQADRFAVGRHADPDILAAAFNDRHDGLVGEMLGFPECCRTFFDRVWNQLGKRDTTPYMAAAGVLAPPACNILGRWLGVRAVPHLPCSFECLPTHFAANQFAFLWPARELAWMLEILSWPVRYSALHGIAIVTMPVVKVVTDTDYTATELRIDKPGTRYPDEAPFGLDFPFQQPRPSAQPLLSLSPRVWTDNGFSSREAMDRAHTALLAHVPRGLESVIDLGAGNGQLLARIGAPRSVGLEADAGRATRGAFHGVRHGRIEDVPALEQRFDLAILARRRLFEMSAEACNEVLTWLQTNVRQALFYSYDVEPVEAILVPAGSVRDIFLSLEARR